MVCRNEFKQSEIFTKIAIFMLVANCYDVGEMGTVRSLNRFGTQKTFQKLALIQLKVARD